jgi:predicted nucleotidyltransferase
VTRLLCFGSRVELFSPWHPFDHEVLRRAPERQLGGRRIRIHTAEDLIVYKKASNRSKDIEDIKAILAAQPGRLDLDRIRAGAGQLLDEAATQELEDLIRDFYR